MPDRNREGACQFDGVEAVEIAYLLPFRSFLCLTGTSGEFANPSGSEARSDQSIARSRPPRLRDLTLLRSSAAPPGTHPSGYYPVDFFGEPPPRSPPRSALLSQLRSRLPHGFEESRTPVVHLRVFRAVRVPALRRRLHGLHASDCLAPGDGWTMAFFRPHGEARGKPRPELDCG